MKKNTMTLMAAGVCAAVVAQVANAAVVYTSALTAPPMTAGNLVGQDNWVAISGSGLTPIQVGVSGTTLTQGSGSREDAGRSFTAIGANQTYYFGFNVKVTGGNTNVYFAHLGDGGTANFAARVFVTASTGSDFTFGLGGARRRGLLGVQGSHSEPVTA